MTISDKTRKLLWSRAGNRCALCQRALIAPESGADGAAVVGDECHIISRAENGPRHDPYYAEDVDHYDNLLLLCKADHKLVDDQVATYTVERLRTLKQQHERVVEMVIANHFQSPEPPANASQPVGFDNFRTTIWFVPDQAEATLERFQQQLIRDARLAAYGKVATGFKSNPTGRYAAWIQAFLPVSPRLIEAMAAQCGVHVIEVSHERLPKVYRSPAPGAA